MWEIFLDHEHMTAQAKPNNERSLNIYIYKSFTVGLSTTPSLQCKSGLYPPVGS